MRTGTTRRFPAAGGGRVVAAGVIRAIAGVVAAIIVIGIALVIFEANAANVLVDALLDVARWLVGPFKGVFELDDGKLQVVVNWGLAAVIYYAIGALVGNVLAR